MDMKLEVVMLPVRDVDRAKSFYIDQVGFNLDVDHKAGDSFRVVQLTPPGSACSATLGVGITDAEPGSVRGTHLVVTDIDTARAELVGRGVEVSDIRHMDAGEWKPGVDPTHTDYNSFADFADPDGNTWILQERGYHSAGTGAGSRSEAEHSPDIPSQA
jgi:catechol 2,3-dioxygenase-like lactoylglutathione lyase family enzyme